MEGLEGQIIPRSLRRVPDSAQDLGTRQHLEVHGILVNQAAISSMLKWERRLQPCSPWEQIHAKQLI